MTSPPRNLLFDLLRVLSAQMIFFHHLSLYGPFAEAWHQVNTVLASWLAHYGRYAVQVFLVLAGALAAQSMDLTNPQSPSLAFLTKRVFNRYLRLLKPYSFILLVTLGLTALARPWIAGDMLPIEQTWAKHFEAVLLHLSFLQSLSGIESLSTGVWYMAIDLQLFALFCLGDFLLARFGPTQIQAKTSIWLAAVLAGIA